MSNNQAFIIIFFVLIILPLTIGLSGYRYNTTASIPAKFWKTNNKENHYLKNDYITICLNNKIVQDYNLKRHFPGEYIKCGNTPILIKKIIGTAGDFVLINEQGIKINKVLINNTKPLLPNYYKMNKTIPAGKFLVVGEISKSLDSRYFGLIDKSLIQNKIERVFNEKN